MTPQTAITIFYPGSSLPDTETTWGEFAALNADDADMLAYIERKIADGYCARIGGGADPEMWIFA